MARESVGEAGTPPLFISYTASLWRGCRCHGNYRDNACTEFLRTTEALDSSPYTAPARLGHMGPRCPWHTSALSPMFPCCYVWDLFAIFQCSFFFFFSVVVHFYCVRLFHRSILSVNEEVLALDRGRRSPVTSYDPTPHPCAPKTKACGWRK